MPHFFFASMSVFFHRSLQVFVGIMLLMVAVGLLFAGRPAAIGSAGSITTTPSPSSTPSSTATETPSPTPTATATATYLPQAFTAALFVPASSPTPTPSPTPSETPTPTATATAVPGAEWLTYLNAVRAQSGLMALLENASWSQGDYFHSRYMVKNDYVGHSEDPANPWYTPEGDAAAQSGNVVVSSWTGTTDKTALDWWLTAPFHAISMLDPQLAATGFGAYREAIGSWQMGATLDVLRGRGPLPPETVFPIFFPGVDAASAWLQFGGNEWPDPLGSCSGYSAPTGPPLLVQLGDGAGVPQVTATTLSVNGQAAEHCAFDETTYTHPDSAQQTTGRLILANRDAVVLLPRQPFSPGQTVAASVTAGGDTHSWQFTVATTARPLIGAVQLGRSSAVPTR